MALEGRVSIAFDANMLDDSPTWTVIDDVAPNLVARVVVEDGRQTEQDQTEPGRAYVYLNDRDGLFDPNNVTSPYFGKLDSKPIAIAAWNPVDSEWVDQWRGTIDDIRTTLNPSTADGVSILANVVIECVDLFDYLGRAEMQVGVSGNTPPTGSEGTIYYSDGDGVDDRIAQVLLDAQVPTGRCVVFSGNVNVLATQYDPGDAFLAALQEAADAEFPGIANIYVDKLGRFVFHGRFARLDPDTVWTSIAGSDPARDAVWKFRRWKAGDGAAITADISGETAQLREFAFGRPRDLIVNSATCYPADIAEADVPAQLSKDDTSIGQHGIHGRSDTDLIVKEHKTNSDTGAEQCKKYADFWIQYYAQPLDRIERIVFKSIAPTDDRATATWGLLTGVSISDIVNVTVGYPQGVGIQGADFYVEGRRMTIEPLGSDYDLVTLELNLSPAITDTEGIFD